MSNDAAMIFREANPYAHDSSMRDPVRLVRDPGVLTLADLDRLVTARIDDARKEWAAETTQACAKAWEQGRAHGSDLGARTAHDLTAREVTQVIRGRLNHSVRHLRERMDRPKTTIKAERVFCEQVANEISAAIMALCGIEGVKS